MLLFLISLVLSGLVIGALARLALPGPDPIGILGTIGLGLAGAFVGGFLGLVLIGRPFGFVLSVLVATGLLYAYRRLFQGRGLTGPRR